MPHFFVTLIILFFSTSCSKPAQPMISINSRVPAKDVTEIKYHVGPVMSPTITVHIIWYGNWSSSSKRVIRDFINSFSAPSLRSPSVSEWWRIVQQYSDLTNANVSKTLQLGNEINDKHLSYGRLLTRFSVQLVIKAAINAKMNPLPVNTMGGMYLVLTSEHIVMQDFCTMACGFHFFAFPETVGFAMPYAWIGNSGRMCPGFCAYPFAVPTYMPGRKSYKPPNGDVGIDGMISAIAHEIAELATNPLVNAWYAGEDPKDPIEIADMCLGYYGVGGGGGLLGAVRMDQDGAIYNMNGVRHRRFLVQWVWDHVESRCNGP